MGVGLDQTINLLNHHIPLYGLGAPWALDPRLLPLPPFQWFALTFYSFTEVCDSYESLACSTPRALVVFTLHLARGIVHRPLFTGH